MGEHQRAEVGLREEAGYFVDWVLACPGLGNRVLLLPHESEDGGGVARRYGEAI